MHDRAALPHLAIIVGLAIPAVALAHRLRLPPLVAFLLAGIVIGPDGAGLIPDPADVAALSEIGVVLLLFAVGLELSLSEVLRWGRSVLVSTPRTRGLEDGAPARSRIPASGADRLRATVRGLRLRPAPR